MQLLKARQNSLLQIHETKMLIAFSACAHGGLEKCDIGCIENNFDVVYGMCKEFKFKAPSTAKLMDMMQAGRCQTMLVARGRS